MVTQRARLQARNSVFDLTAGRLAHLASPAFSRTLRELRTICQALHDEPDKRNLPAPGREPASDPAAGSWTVCDCINIGARRYVITRFRPNGSGAGRDAPFVSRGRDVLTPRERTIVEALANGAALKEVAFEQAISVQAVSTYLARARRKLGVTSRADLIRAVRASRAGADAFAAEDEVVLAQLSFASEHFRIIERQVPAGGGSFDLALTPAEQEILPGILQGLTNAEIACWRATSVRTVGAQVSALMMKLGAMSRAEIIARLMGSASKARL